MTRGEMLAEVEDAVRAFVAVRPSFRTWSINIGPTGVDVWLHQGEQADFEAVLLDNPEEDEPADFRRYVVDCILAPLEARMERKARRAG